MCRGIVCTPYTDKDLNRWVLKIFVPKSLPSGEGRHKGAGGGLGWAGRETGVDTASDRLGGLASGFKLWMNAAREGNVRAGRVYRGRH